MNRNRKYEFHVLEVISQMHETRRPPTALTSILSPRERRTLQRQVREAQAVSEKSISDFNQNRWPPKSVT